MTNKSICTRKCCYYSNVMWATYSISCFLPSLHLNWSVHPWFWAPEDSGGGGTRYILGSLFKTKMADFPTLFKTEFRFLIPCLRQKSLIIVIIIRLFIVQEKIPCLRQKLIKSVPCLRQKSRKTYPGWPLAPLSPYKEVPPPRDFEVISLKNQTLWQT